MSAAKPSLMLTLPIRLVSEANARDKWGRIKRAKEQRRVVALKLNTVGRRTLKPPLALRITRIAPRRLDDDNLARSAKAVRDQLCDWLGYDDGDERLSFAYAQCKGQPKEYAVRIEVYEQAVARTVIERVA